MITCQTCDTVNHDGAIFCDGCGLDLSAAPSHSSPTAPPQIRSGRPTVAPIATSATAPYSSVPGPSPAASPEEPPPTIRLTLPDGHYFILRRKTSYIIGRNDGTRMAPDVDLTSFYGVEAGVSRLHLRILARPDGVFVEDLESRNETVHNGYRLLPQQWYPLHHGDELKLGAITLHVSFERP